MPLLPVATVALLALPEKEPAALLCGMTVNVMLTPAPIGLPAASCTSAPRAVPKGVPMVACRGVPALAMMRAGGPGRFVRLNDAAVARELVDRLAVTV